jgi:hypothetical protein
MGLFFVLTLGSNQQWNIFCQTQPGREKKNMMAGMNNQLSQQLGFDMALCLE